MKRSVRSAVMVTVALLAFLGVGTREVSAETNSMCSTTDNRVNPAIGTDVPVVLVHGIDGSPADWEQSKGSTICDDIDNLSNVTVALNYGYGKQRVWAFVANQLVPKIAAIAKQSAQNGGPGKVVVVAYSLGTAVIRTALSNDQLKNKVSQVITVAAPNLNPWESYPDGVIVRAIAGDVTKVVVWGKNRTYIDTHSDGLIGVHTALLRYTDNPEIGGGRVTLNCTETYQNSVFGRHLSPFNDTCEHGNLLKNPQVASSIVIGIEAYADSLGGGSAPTVNFNVHDLMLHFPTDKWFNVTYGAGGPGEDIQATDSTNIAPCNNCSEEGIETYAFLQVFATGDCSLNTEQCVIGDAGVVAPAPSVTVGGRTPDYSARYNESGYQGTALVWCFTDEELCIHYRRAADEPQLEVSDAMRTLLAGATWTS